MKSYIYFKGTFCTKLPSIQRVKLLYIFMSSSVKYFYVAVCLYNNDGIAFFVRWSGKTWKKPKKFNWDIMCQRGQKNYVSVQIEVHKTGRVPSLPSSENTDRRLIEMTLKNNANTRVGTLIVATIYLQLIQYRYMFRSFTVLQCSHQHCVQPVASDVEVVGYL